MKDIRVISGFTYTSSINKGGRPSMYTQELANKICAQLAEGISLRTVCLGEDMPTKTTVFNWLGTNKSFVDQYARAKEESADAMAEEILDLSDGAIDVIKNGAEKKSGALAQSVRLQVDTRKWIMSKMKPKKYGDKIDMTTNGKDLPTPILGGTTLKNAVHTNNNGEQNNISTETS